MTTTTKKRSQTSCCVTPCDAMWRLVPSFSFVKYCCMLWWDICNVYCNVLYFTLILCDVVWRYVMSCDAMWLHVTSFGFMKNFCIQWYNVCNVHCNVLCFTFILCDVMWRYVTSCYFMWLLLASRSIVVYSDVMFVMFIVMFYGFTIILSDVMWCYVTSRDVFLWWNALLKVEK